MHYGTKGNGSVPPNRDDLGQGSAAAMQMIVTDV